MTQQATLTRKGATSSGLNSTLNLSWYIFIFIFHMRYNLRE